jgi:cytochrome oxidase Cu insertion factor (SCO1/SenC/PrrC family)
MTVIHTRRPMSMTRRYVILGLVSLSLGTVYAFVLKSSRTSASSGEGSVLSVPADSPEAFKDVAPFTLQDSTGATVTRETLLGKPWIAGFVFTRCTGPCPVVTSNMKKAQDLLEGDDVRLVTFSVDAEHDTPEVLAAYARSVGADTRRWTFLTGDPAVIQALSVKSFLLPIVEDEGKPPGERVVHRTDLAVVDGRGRVRGYYDGESQAGVEAAVARARFLAREAGTGPR